MSLSPRFSTVLAVAFAFSFTCCRQGHSKSEILAAMRQYDRLIKKVDADAIALLYTEDGTLGNMARGRDSIRRFLARFKNVRVLSQASTTDSIVIAGDSAVQKGAYKQAAVVSEKDTLYVSGMFNATWQWTATEGWRIKRMETTPAH